MRGLATVLFAALATSPGSEPEQTDGMPDAAWLPLTSRDPGPVGYWWEQQPPPPLDALVGWSAATGRRFYDPQRRVPWTPALEPFGATFGPGEAFSYDVRFAGSPAGLVQAEVVEREPGPHDSPDVIHLHAMARTSGIAALMTTMVDHMDAWVDARTGAPLRHVNVVERSGWLRGKYRRRVTEATWLGRGEVRLVDVRDGEIDSGRWTVPRNTLDVLSMLQWMRALNLDVGDDAHVFVLDGEWLERVEIERVAGISDMPSVPLADSLGIDEVVELRGRIIRVDVYGRPDPDKEPRELEIWIGNDPRRIPLAVQTDVWFGALKLTLSSYDPPAAKPR